MNSENTQTIKKVLEEACGGASVRSEGWEAQGVERLYLDACAVDTLQDFKGGLVEVRHGERNTDSVRMELELAPALAAKVIAIVTNTTLGELPDLTEPEQAAIEEAVAVGGATIVVQGDIVQGQFSEQDRRNKEIADLIRAQRKDDVGTDEEDELPSSDDPEELNFDVPADVERS